MKTIVIVLLIFISLVIGYVTTTGVKSQVVRLMDVLILGPFLIWIGVKEVGDGKYKELYQIILIFFGATTIAYNLKNYLYQKNKY